MQPRNSALERACEVLELRVAEARRTGSLARLPALAELAFSAGVSTATMHRAVGRLKAQGALWTVPGQGTYVGFKRKFPEQSQSQAMGRSLRYLWERTKARIENDLATGRFASEAYLPEIRDLLSLYGVNYRTLRKALSSLAEEGRLEWVGARLRPATAHRLPAHNTVVCFARGASSADEVGALQKERVRLLESMCLRHNLDLFTVHYSFTPHGLRPVANREREAFSRAADNRVLGFVVLTEGLEHLGLRRFVRRLTQYERAIAVLDTQEVLQPGDIRGAGRHLRLFSAGGSRTAGLEMGRHLIDLGHRRCVYLSPYHGTEWSRSRLGGLQQAFAGIGELDAVRAVTAGSESYRAEALYPAVDFRAARERILERGIDPASEAQKLVGDAIAKLIGPITETIGSRQLSRAVESLLEQTMREGEITALVCANDAVAELCLAGLRARHSAVPRDVSVCGFDNSYAAVFNRMTSYSFGEHDALQAMVASLVHRDRGKTGGGVPERKVIGGSVTRRGTTARRRVR